MTIRSMFIATLAVSAVLGAGVASAQDFKAVPNAPQAFGAPPQATVTEPTLGKSADLLGIRRTGAQTVGNVNILEFNARGTMTDWETAGAKEITLDNFTFNASIFDNAARITFQGQGTPLTIRVVKGTKAWDESWSKDNKLTTKASDANVASRRVIMWLEPHAVVHAAVFAFNGRCPDNRMCADLPKPAVTTGADGKGTFSVTIEGNVYKVTLGPDQRPARVETSVGGKTYAASYFGYRNGTSLGQEALDKMHNGTYWPSRMTLDVGGAKVLDMIITAGWSNPYSIYPDPDLLAKAQ